MSDPIRAVSGLWRGARSGVSTEQCLAVLGEVDAEMKVLYSNLGGFVPPVNDGDGRSDRDSDGDSDGVTSTHAVGGKGKHGGSLEWG